MLLYINKVKVNQKAFADKVIHISSLLGINPDWLMFIMNFESAESFSPSIRNPYSNGTGLIQFMPKTAISLGTTVDLLARMSNVQQLDYVYKYFKPYKGRYKNIEDLYLVTFYPYALGKPDTYLIGSEKSISYVEKVAKQNPSLDINKDGKISLGEWKQALKQIVRSRVSQEQYDLFFCPNLATS